VLIAVAADKGAPGVTTTAVALAAVWPRPVLLAECDPAGGDLVYRLPGEGGGRLDPRRGLLSLAVAARRDLQPSQLWTHAQKLRGGLDVLLGVTSAEQGTGLEPLWGPVGSVLAGLPQADVIADCGRLGPDGAYYDLLVHAAAVVLVTRPSLGEMVRLRDRAAAVALAVRQRSGQEARVGVLVVADHRVFSRALAEVGQVLGAASVLGGIAFEPRSAELLRGEWGGRLDKSLLIRTAREVAGQLAGRPAVVGGRAARGGRSADGGRAAAAAPAHGGARAGDPGLGADPRPALSPLPVRSGPGQAGPGHGGAAHGTGPGRGGGTGHGGGAARHAAGRVTASLPPAELFGPPPAGPTEAGLSEAGLSGAGLSGAGLSGAGLPVGGDLPSAGDFPAADLPAAEPGGW
jgi:hypothetical protein